jgi:hypothetical protein
MGNEEAGSENESNNSEEDDVIEDLPAEELKKKSNMRTSVSAEAFGKWNKKEDFKAPSYPKAPHIKE